MLDSKGIKTTLIVESIVWIAWCAIILIFADYDKVGFYFWGGLICGVLAFAISFVSRVLIKPKNNRTTTEVGFIATYCTDIFLVVEIVCNTIFILIADAKYNVIVVIVNVVVFVVFISARIYAGNYLQQVASVSEYSSKKMQYIANISRQLGYMLGLTTNPSVKKKLRVLKENVDYSNNVSESFTKEYEERFLLDLSQIQTAIDSNMDEDEIIRRIDEADKTWRGRNGVLSATK